MREIRHYNAQLLKNILPDHVANYFLTQERPTEVRGTDHCPLTTSLSPLSLSPRQQLYAQSYSCCAVLFASIPSFANFYSEDVNNGVECIRLLNEIIFDFDQVRHFPLLLVCFSVHFFLPPLSMELFGF